MATVKSSSTNSNSSISPSAGAADECGGDIGPKRLHVSNIPFRFRDNDLRTMFGVSLFTLFFTTETSSIKASLPSEFSVTEPRLK